MATKKIIATKGGITKGFGYVQWAILADKKGNHDGWVEVGTEGAQAERFIPQEIKSNAADSKKKEESVSPAVKSESEVPADEKDALAALEKTVNKTGEPAAPVEIKEKKKSSGGKKKKSL